MNLHSDKIYKDGKRDFHRHIVCIVFFIGLFMPILLGLIYKFSGRRLDIQLGGYTDSTDRLPLNIQNYSRGEFQDTFEKWYDENLIPRGVLIKSYNQICYSLFDLSSSGVVIGQNDNMLNESEIVEAIGNKIGYNSSEDRYNVQDWLDTLSSIKEKLSKVNKYLVVYITPSKTTYHYDDIPYRYKVLRQNNALRSVDYLRENISETGIEFIDYRDILDDKYPIFYKTGEHWSCTAEQEMMGAIIASMTKISGKRLRTFEIDGVESSNTPYFSELDYYNIVNVFSKPTENEFYQYRFMKTFPDSYDHLGVFVQGDSFANTFLEYNYMSDDIYRLFYGATLYQSNGSASKVDDDFDSMDLGNILDRVDFVLIECLESQLPGQGRTGFVAYLDSFLDSYIPSEEYKNQYPKRLVWFDRNFKDITYSRGLVVQDGNLYMGNECSYIINNAKVKERGLQIDAQLTDGGGIAKRDYLYKWEKNL